MGFRQLAEDEALDTPHAKRIVYEAQADAAGIALALSLNRFFRDMNR